MFEYFNFKSCLLFLLFVFGFMMAYAADTTNITGVDDMLNSGKQMVGVAAKWGGIITVVGAALALGSGRLEGALAQTICKVIVVIGLLIAAYGYFGSKVSWGFAW